jgi:predicted dehydrogenase
VLLRGEGVLADIEVSHISWIPRPRWYILGDRGGLTYDGSTFRLRTRAGESPVAREATNEDAFYLNVSQAVQGKARLAVTPEDAREVIRVIEAGFLSAESGQVVTLSGEVSRPNLDARGKP